MEQPSPKKRNYIMSTVLLIGVAFFVFQIVLAAAPDPGHNFSTVSGGAAQGDLLYGSATDTLSALPKDTNATRYLSNTGTTNNPAWAQVNLTNGVTGALPVGNIAAFTGLGDCDTAATSKLLWDITAGTFSCGTDQTVGSGWTDDGAVVRLTTIGDNVGIGTIAPGYKLAVSGTASVSGGFFGSGLSDCDTAGTSKLLWDVTTGRFSCGADQGVTASASANFGPATDNTYSLGNTAYRWKSLYLGPGSLHMTSTTGTSGSTANYTDAILQFTAGSSLSLGTSAVGTGNAGSLELRTNNTSRLYVTGTGNVGIGTITPTNLLDIAGNASVSGALEVNNLVVNGNVGLGTTAPYRLAVNGTIGIYNAGALNFSNDFQPHDFSISQTGGGNLVFGSSVSFAMIIRDDGRIGIGTTTPVSILEVAGTPTFSGLYIANAPTNQLDFRMVRNNDELVIGASQSNNLNLTPSGNVGIGVTAPKTNLNAHGAHSTPSSTSTPNGIFGMSAVDGVILTGGVYATGGSFPYNIWLQGRHTALDIATVTYPIVLQPLGGNVGIGISPSTAKLLVGGTSALEISAYSTGAATVSVAGNSNAAGTASFDLEQDNVAAYVWQRANQPLYLGTNSTTAMAILGNGNIGIGSSVPGSKVEIVPGGGWVNIPYVAGKTDGYSLGLGNFGGYIWRNYNGGFADMLNISTNYYINDAGSNVIPNAGGFTAAFMIGGPGTIDFRTGATNTVPTSKMFIANNGNIGIGKSPGAQLDLSTDSARKLTTTTWATGSDSRIKTDIRSIDDALEIIRRVRPVKYRYDAEFLAANPSVVNTTYYNFIAQEYRDIFPESVTETDGLLYMNSSNMIPYAIAGVKALDAQISNEVTTKSICVSDDSGAKTCINKAQLDALIADAGSGSTNVEATPTPSSTPTPTPVEPNSVPVEPSGNITPTPDATISTEPVPSFSTQPLSETPDTNEPVISLVGDDTINLAVGDSYDEPGATATDGEDDSVAVVISGIYDTTATGSYTISYNATDDAGNEAQEVTRTINVGGASPALPETGVLTIAKDNQRQFFIIVGILVIIGTVLSVLYAKRILK